MKRTVFLPYTVVISALISAGLTAVAFHVAVHIATVFFGRPAPLAAGFIFIGLSPLSAVPAGILAGRQKCIAAGMVILAASMLSAFMTLMAVGGNWHVLGSWQQFRGEGLQALRIWGPYFTVAGLFAGAIVYTRRWRKLRNNMEECRQCGYNLTGNVSGKCPECGSPVPEDLVQREKDGGHDAKAGPRNSQAEPEP